MEADVVLVGHGVAGAAAITTVQDKGASVIILEKMSFPGGNTRLSGGYVTIPRYSQARVNLPNI